MRNIKYMTALMGAVFLMAVCSFAGGAALIETPTTNGRPDSSSSLFSTGPAVGDPCESIDEFAKSKPAESSLVERACQLIYQGQFDAAGDLIKKSDEATQRQCEFLSELEQVVHQYRAICQNRQSTRNGAYKEKLAELERLRARWNADGNDISNTSDANDISQALLVIAKAREFADDQQREQLLSRPFVKQTIQRAIDKAAEYESEGKWLDAYLTCYSWLTAIEPNNQAYADYAQELVDKANIVASFQDSPCESRAERFKGVKKEIFIWAVAFLRVYYVDIIDYKQMATKAIQRCKLLGQVLNLSFSELSKGLTGVSSEDNLKSPFLPPDKIKLSAWLSALAAIMDEVEQSPTGVDRDKFIEVFQKVQAVNKTTLKLPEQVLVAQFAEAALSALDPYTVIVWPKQVQDFEKMMTNEFTGIGIEITKQKGRLTVASLLPDTPAYKSGLDAGDVIEKVNGVETKDMTLICAVHKITGPKGTKVTLTIRRAGQEQTRDITITRAKITVPTLRGWQRTTEGKWLYMIDPQNKIGYVRITSFSEKTPDDLEKVLDELEAKGLKGLILDLRFNSGGLLDSATGVADKFVAKDLIVKTEPRGGKMPVWIPAHKENTHPHYPLVILINSGSASASEIVAGALADPLHNRAILVGDRTHGKGSVQGITHYPGGGAQLKYTMANYHLPSGQKVESRAAAKKKGRSDWGIGPNIEVKLRSDELKKLIDVQRDNDVLVKAGPDNTTRKLKKHPIEETLAADPQLAVGALVIKTKLIETQAHLQARAG